jgi:hypothetical protein
MRTNNYENINCEVIVDNLLNAKVCMIDIDNFENNLFQNIHPLRMFIAIILAGLYLL